MTTEDSLPVLEPSGIGEVINYGMCPRYTKLRFDEDTEEAVKSARDWKTAFQPLSVLYSQTGNKFEQEIYEVLREHSTDVIESWKGYSEDASSEESYAKEENDTKIQDVVKEVANKDKTEDPTVLFQTPFAGQIARFFVAGDADVVLIWPQKGEKVKIRIFDIKSSWEEKTYHQIQTACYTILLKDILNSISVNYEVEGGIIYRESTVTPVTPENLPQFTLETREDDVFRLLQTDGFFEKTLTTPYSEIDYQIGPAAENSTYAETYFVDSLEQKDISLLGLTRGEQKAFTEVGLETLEDVASLIEPVSNPQVYEYETPIVKANKQETVQRLEEEFGIGEQISVLAQRAQALLSSLNPSHPAAWSKNWTPYIKGAGNLDIPDDDPPDWMDTNIESNSLIRVYLNVQRDHITDSLVMLSGRVDCTKHTGSPFTFSTIVDEMTVDKRTMEKQEKQLLKDFTTDLFDAIEMMASLTGNREKAPIHFYFYTDSEYNDFKEKVQEVDSQNVNSVRDLLGLREGIDQKMVSVLKPEIEKGVALTQPSYNLLPVTESLYPDDEKARLEHTDWRYTRDDGSTVNLRRMFNFGLFDYSIPYIEELNGIEFDLEGQTSSPDGYLPAVPHGTSQIPLEYIWGCDEIDTFTPEWTDKPQYKGIINQYRYLSSNNAIRITKEDLLQLGRRLSHAVHHIERSLDYARDPKITKKPLTVKELPEFSLGEATLKKSVEEYLELEYLASKSESLQHYRLPLKKRMLTGKSVPLEITDARIEDGLLFAEAEMMYDEFEFGNPKRVAEACRYAGASTDEASSGKNVLASPLEETASGFDVSLKPSKILHSVPLSVESFEPETGKIFLKGFPNGSSSEDKYVSWHKNYTTDPSEVDKFTHLFASGETFFLDPTPDDLTANRSQIAIDNLKANPIAKKINKMLTQELTEPTTSLFDNADIAPFLDWLSEDYNPSPNEEQTEFITELTGSFSLLQGPPGTGKTSGALAPAILARLYAAHSSETRLRSLVTGSSNKSIDEILEDVSEALANYNNTSNTKEELDDVLLIRLTDGEPEDSLDNVQYVNYHEDTEMLEKIWKRLDNTGESRQTSLFEQDEDVKKHPHIVVFSTPSRVFGLADKIPIGGDEGAERAYELSPDIFDVLAVDEASMMPLSELFMASSFLTKNSQTLITGDQRQMPPVQKYDWKEEDRRTITETIPFLSTLDYFRFLRGETVDSIEENTEIESPDATIPMTRLQKTYRCHTDVADFLRRWVYAQDGIDYHSEETSVVKSQTPTTEGITKATRNDSAITVILHDDEKSRQSNLSEAYISSVLSEVFSDDNSIGLVTPHNAQKGLLNSMCSGIDIDTVERFQGGEKDAMIVSATVSDPDYIEAEEDFIMNPNRLNVALSRMKKRLVIIAPKTLFEMIPKDIEMYDNSTIWKGLYNEVCTNKQQVWSGSIDEFTGQETNLKTSLEVFIK